MKQFALVLLLGVGTTRLGLGAEPPKAPVPKSPYISVVYRYADTLIERGRDTFGPQKTGLFLSALDRRTLAPLTNRPAAPTGVREFERVGAAGTGLVGANPQHDENLLRLLYTLSELSAKPKYRAAADESLKWFLENASAPASPFLPWGKAHSWNVMTDTANGKGEELHEFFRPWLLWDCCFDVAPEASRRYALALWESLRLDGIDRPTGISHRLGKEGLRQAGFRIRTWAVSYARTKDERCLTAMAAVMEWLEKIIQPMTGSGNGEHGLDSMASLLSCAIDCDGAAHRVPEPLAGRLRALAEHQDAIFCAQNNEAAGGFVMAGGRMKQMSTSEATSLWAARAGGPTTAQIGMMCVSRYDNGGRVAYRDLITAAADLYTEPTEDADAWPVTFGQAISLELAAWRHTARPVYLERARRLGDLAVEKYWGTNALPRASLKSEHYEAISGPDTLALALLELHLNILHITAVRCPPNTIDR